MKLLLFTDIHLRQDNNSADRLRLGLGQARARHPDANHLVILGDLAVLLDTWTSPVEGFPAVEEVGKLKLDPPLHQRIGGFSRGGDYQKG